MTEKLAGIGLAAGWSICWAEIMKQMAGQRPVLSYPKRIAWKLKRGGNWRFWPLETVDMGVLRAWAQPHPAKPYRCGAGTKVWHVHHDKTMG